MSRQDMLLEEYRARINRAIDYIEAHIDEELSLASIANVANFSRYHFHRIFSAMLGETVNRFIQRVRIERAATQLVANPRKSITEIALDCGFSGSATFARAFKDYFKMSASEWRDGGYSKICKTNSNDSQTDGNTGKEFNLSSSYIVGEHYNQTWRISKMNKDQVKIEVKKVPEFTVAYTRYIGPYKGDEALFKRLFEKLFTWAGPRNLISFPDTKVIAVYHDNPDLTDESKLRVSACISVPKDTKVDGDLGKMQITGGIYAIGHFELNVDEYEEAWKMMYGEWLPQSGYQPDDRACYELYLNDPNEHPSHKHIVDIYIPVKPM